jgi:Cu-processing system permease protein
MITRLVKYVFADILRGKIILGYTGFLFVASFGVFNLAGDQPKGVVGLLSLILMVVPLVSLVFGVAHYYNSREFIELLAAQPLKRMNIIVAQIVGVTGALGLALLIGVGVPVAMYASDLTGLTLVVVGLALTTVFVLLAFLAAIVARDKARGLGAALLIWFYFALLHDGLTLYLLFLLEDFPLEGASVALLSCNPIDVGRLLVLLPMDIAALMGYSGALLRDKLGTGLGAFFAVAVLSGWILLPFASVVQLFRRKDL